MSVSVVDIREMQMFVYYGDMTMHMVMRLITIPIEIVTVLMVFVMNMPMTMLHRLMYVFVFMMLRQVQPDAPTHEARRQPECQCRGFTQQRQCHRRANKGSGRKIGSCTCRPQTAQSQHEQYETDAVAEQPNGHRSDHCPCVGQRCSQR